MCRRHVPRSALACFSMGLAILPLSQAQAWELQTQYRDSSKTTAKQLWYPQQTGTKELTSELRARAYLRNQAKQFGLSADLRELKLVETKQSLLGTHLSFQQMQGEWPIESALITVSELRDGTIYQVYSTLEKITASYKKVKAKISEEEAYERAWQHLQVRGPLFEAPKARLGILVSAGVPKLVYKVELSTLAPYGAWLVSIDAETGQIISSEDQRISHKPRAKKITKLKLSGPLLNRQQAFLNWNQQAKANMTTTLESKDGVANIFDPDPRTSLLDRTLDNTSSADSFTAAYQQRELKDLSFDGRNYSLAGPWVKIIDFDPPRTRVSQSPDGQWLFKRGNNSFNDAMTYYHIDQSQRYIQSLGFKEASGIQFGPIEADSDGVNGEDNSYFQPSSNRLSFGHGCVDDNEDTDVILHEYGHAIHFSINPLWSGGDTGAMGEGFGDYWAASYSISTSHGKDFFPNEVYSWDGHGQTGSCWAGRILNAMQAHYDPNRTYSAHSSIPGGFQSDELWSTPLFQSLQTLMAEGVSREEVDRIVLQAQFGLGTQVKMREMAQSVLASAQLLYPDGPHYRVFKDNFLRHNIIEEPHPILQLTVAAIQDSNDDGAIDPGEDIELKIVLKNRGTLAAEQVQLSLSSGDSNVQIDPASSAYPPLGVGQEAGNETSLHLRVSQHIACGAVLPIEATVTFQGQGQSKFTFPLRVGKAIGISQNMEARFSIPDNDPRGIEIPLPIEATGSVSDQLKIAVQIAHPYRGDLRLKLQTPSGKQLVLHDREGFSERDLRGVYPLNLRPKEPLKDLLGEEIGGVWKLLIQDLAPTDAGTIESWGIEDISRYSCTVNY